jgi:hypothetical protein
MATRDYPFEALAEVTGTDWTAGRGELNAALKSIREQAEIEDDYLLADEIQARAKLYRQVMPEVMLTPSALAKHWLRVFEEANRKPAVASNQNAAATRCATCGGDRFVLVSRRPAVQSQWMKEKGIEVPESEGFEEYAACPDCNTTDTTFHRHDGSVARALDPGKVREMMNR